MHRVIPAAFLVVVGLSIGFTGCWSSNVPAIKRLTQEGLQVTLALSLHAPDDELRNTLVPVNNRSSVAMLTSISRLARSGKSSGFLKRVFVTVLTADGATLDQLE